MSDNILSLHHCSVIVADTKLALTFYCDLLGLTLNNERPDLGYPGAWLEAGEQQIHLLQLPNPDRVEDRPEHGGRDRHLALKVKTLSTIKNSLENAGVDYTLSKSGRQALFCRDPDGNAVEIIQV